MSYGDLAEIKNKLAAGFEFPVADGGPTAPVIRATPFVWKSPDSIPLREWLYGRHYIRRYPTGTVSPGGLGKSSLVLVEALAMVTGRDLLGIKPRQPLRVWYWNGEDPREEIDRRVAAACDFHDLTQDEVEGRLFVDSGRDCEIIIASETKDGAAVATPVIEALEATITENQIDLLIVDPFISSHQVSENDNAKIAMVIKAYARLADRCNIGIELVHHVRKGNGQSETTVDDGRGAGAFKDHLRSVRVLNAMNGEEADAFGIQRRDRTKYFRVDTGKANLAPPSADTIWRQLVGVSLRNGRDGAADDLVGVVDQWHSPGLWGTIKASDVLRAQQDIAKKTDWRLSPQSPQWVGISVAESFGLDVDNPTDRSRIKEMLKAWFGSGLLRTTVQRDEARRERQCVEVGKWIEL